ncbi:hypothetical protein [Dactylosporangium sp. NPDC051541]|uniref:hypothetical protein n=1 Tax=Dactylosporangium sp. NPDC051541 TaxID=3363977 RepID=UPI003799BF72
MSEPRIETCTDRSANHPIQQQTRTRHRLDKTPPVIADTYPLTHPFTHQHAEQATADIRSLAHQLARKVSPT